jgi:hypothetical protein
MSALDRERLAISGGASEQLAEACLAGADYPGDGKGTPHSKVMRDKKEDQNRCERPRRELTPARFLAQIRLLGSCGEKPGA